MATNRNFKLIEVGKRIYHARFDKPYNLISAFIRLQEFYESPSLGIRAKYFTLNELMDDYAKRHVNFTYFTDWAGFNVPGHFVKRFLKTFQPACDFSEHEEKLFAAFKPILKSDSKFYVIGTTSDDDLDHEIAHALYYLSPKYRREMLELLDDHPYRDIIRHWILKMGYANRHWRDEAQAYLATSTIEYIKGCGYKMKWGIPSDFSEVYTEFKKKWSNKTKGKEICRTP